VRSKVVRSVTVALDESCSLVIALEAGFSFTSLKNSAVTLSPICFQRILLQTFLPSILCASSCCNQALSSP
jgi:hypothetical protein